MDTVPDAEKASEIAVADQARVAAQALSAGGAGPEERCPLPRIKFSGQRYYIDHPDAELGDEMMADALGVAGVDAMNGILRQLVRAGANGGTPDEVDVSFMISMVKSIKPRDSIEAMLVTQMVSVHVMAMRCSHRLANAQDLVQQESAGRALSRLARTFPAQIEALNRYRNSGEPAITVQNVSVQDGGKAIVGNVTQHASVIVGDRVAQGQNQSSPGQSAQA